MSGSRPRQPLDVFGPHAVLELLGEEGALLADGDVHEVAEEAAVLDGAGEGGLGGLLAAAIADHLPEAFAEGLEAVAELVGESFDSDF